MGIVGFLFGFQGRINRLSFFVASWAQGLLILAAALILASIGELPDMTSVTTAAEKQKHVFDLAQQASGVFVFWSVAQLPLIFKRVRDMHTTMTFAWIYTFFVLIGTAPGLYLLGHGVASLLVTWFSIQGSRAPTSDNDDTILGDERNWQRDSKLDQIDLVARAKELKAAETRLLAEHAKDDAQPMVSKPVFGKRADLKVGNG